MPITMKIHKFNDEQIIEGYEAPFRLIKRVRKFSRILFLHNWQKMPKSGKTYTRNGRSRSWWPLQMKTLFPTVRTWRTNLKSGFREQRELS